MKKLSTLPCSGTGVKLCPFLLLLREGVTEAKVFCYFRHLHFWAEGEGEPLSLPRSATYIAAVTKQLHRLSLWGGRLPELWLWLNFSFVGFQHRFTITSDIFDSNPALAEGITTPTPPSPAVHQRFRLLSCKATCKLPLFQCNLTQPLFGYASSNYSTRKF